MERTNRPEPLSRSLAPGWHALSNGLLDAAWDRKERLTEAAQAWLAAAPRQPEGRPLRRAEPVRRATTREPAEVSPAAPTEKPRLPNDLALRENIDKLRDAPNVDERVAARAQLVRLFRQTIESLPAVARGAMSRDLAGLAAAGSAQGFGRLHERMQRTWGETP